MQILDPDPAFYLNADPDPDTGSQTNVEPCEYPDPDHGHHLHKVNFYMKNILLCR
jgi:hypothetical protein